MNGSDKDRKMKVKLLTIQYKVECDHENLCVKL